MAEGQNGVTFFGEVESALKLVDLRNKTSTEVKPCEKDLEDTNQGSCHKTDAETSGKWALVQRNQAELNCSCFLAVTFGIEGEASILQSRPGRQEKRLTLVSGLSGK